MKIVVFSSQKPRYHRRRYIVVAIKELDLVETLLMHLQS